MTLTCLKLSCSLSLCRIGTLLVVHTPPPCPADVPLAGEGGLAADCIDLRWQQTCANARFVYVHVGVVLAAAHSVAALFTRAGTSAGNLQQGQQLFPASLQCFVQIKRCVRLQRLRGAHGQVKVCPFSSTPGSKAPPGWICRKLEGGMLRAQLTAVTGLSWAHL